MKLAWDGIVPSRFLTVMKVRTASGQSDTQAFLYHARWS